MPTINQLVRKGRKTSTTKSTSPALQHGYNSMKKKTTNKKRHLALLNFNLNLINVH